MSKGTARVEFGFRKDAKGFYCVGVIRWPGRSPEHFVGSDRFATEDEARAAAHKTALEFRQIMGLSVSN